MKVYRWVAFLCVTVGCGHEYPNPKPPPALDFETCLKSYQPRWDPGGQGRELIGFGLLANAVGMSPSGWDKDIPFGRIDRFDPAQIETEDGKRVLNFSIKDNMLIGSVMRDGARTCSLPRSGSMQRSKGGSHVPIRASLARSLRSP